MLRDSPAAGRMDRAQRRALTLPPTPYRPIYRIAGDRVLILAVWHGARQWPPARD
jgi:plasmid stabilization system protein ParE